MIVSTLALIAAVALAVGLVKLIELARPYVQARREARRAPTYVPTAWEHEELGVYREGYTNYEDDDG